MARSTLGRSASARDGGHGPAVVLSLLPALALYVVFVLLPIVQQAVDYSLLQVERAPDR